MVANRFRHRGLSFPVRLDRHGQRKHADASPDPDPPDPAPRPPAASTPKPANPADPAAPLPSALRSRSPAGIRRMIADSSVADMLIDYVEGRIEMEPLKVTVALNLLRKILPDLSNVAPPADLEGEVAPEDLFRPLVEFHIVEPQAQ